MTVRKAKLTRSCLTASESACWNFNTEKAATKFLKERKDDMENRFIRAEDHHLLSCEQESKQRKLHLRLRRERVFAILHLEN